MDKQVIMIGQMWSIVNETQRCHRTQLIRQRDNNDILLILRIKLSVLSRLRVANSDIPARQVAKVV